MFGNQGTANCENFKTNLKTDSIFHECKNAMPILRGVFFSIDLVLANLKNWFGMELNGDCVF